MSKWYIQLKKVGRGKVTEGFEANVPTLQHAEEMAVRRCKRRLAGQCVFLESYDNAIYTVEAEGRTVGVVTITPLEKRKVVP